MPSSLNESQTRIAAPRNKEAPRTPNATLRSLLSADDRTPCQRSCATGSGMTAAAAPVAPSIRSPRRGAGGGLDRVRSLRVFLLVLLMARPSRYPTPADRAMAQSACWSGCILGASDRALAGPASAGQLAAACASGSTAFVTAGLGTRDITAAPAIARTPAA